jgi:hypothetical protein
MSFVAIIYFVAQMVIYFVYLFVDSSQSMPLAVLIIILVFSIPIGLVGFALCGFCTFHLILQVR